MRKEIPFNVNNHVRVKLTPRGIKIYEDSFRKIFGEKFHEWYHPPVIDENGWTKFQLWELMNHFGSHMYNGCDVPFETEIVFLVHGQN